MGGRVTLAVDRRGAAWEVRLDRPASANALSAALVDALHDLLDDVERAAPAVLVLRGNQRHFAAGFDLTDLDGETDASLALRFLRIGTLLDRVASLPCVTVSVVEGVAVGAGADLAAACDHRLALASATVRFPGAAFGVVLGTRRLAALVGGAGALRLAAGSTVVAAEVPGLFTAVHLDSPALERGLAELVGTSSAASPRTRAELLAQTRHGVATTDAALAALARSVSVPGLHGRISRYASSRSKEPAR